MASYLVNIIFQKHEDLDRNGKWKSLLDAIPLYIICLLCPRFLLNCYRILAEKRMGIFKINIIYFFTFC